MAKKIISLLVVMVLMFATGCSKEADSESLRDTIVTEEQTVETESELPELELASADNTESWKTIPYYYSDVDDVFEAEGLECTIVRKGTELEVIRNNEIISKAEIPEDVDEKARDKFFYGYLVGNKGTYYIVVKDRKKNPTLEFVCVSNEILSSTNDCIHVNGYIGSYPIFKKENGDYTVFVPNNESTCKSMLSNNIFLSQEQKNEKENYEFKEYILNPIKFELSYEERTDTLMKLMCPEYWKLRVFYNKEKSIYKDVKLQVSEAVKLTDEEKQQFEGEYDIKDFPQINEKINQCYEKHLNDYYNSLFLKN